MPRNSLLFCFFTVTSRQWDMDHTDPPVALNKTVMQACSYLLVSSGDVGRSCFGVTALPSRNVTPVTL